MDLSVMLDVFSRYVAGWMVAHREVQHRARTAGRLLGVEPAAEGGWDA